MILYENVIQFRTEIVSYVNYTKLIFCFIQIKKVLGQALKCKGIQSLIWFDFAYSIPFIVPVFMAKIYLDSTLSIYIRADKV